jgi:hypothetical protein
MYNNLNNVLEKKGTMMRYKRFIALLILLGSVLLNACIGSGATINQDSSIEDIVKQAHTEAALTIQASMSFTEAAQPIPTNTQIILNTPTPIILATDTPLPTPTATFPTIAFLPSSTDMPQSSSIEYVDGRPCLRAELTFESYEDGSKLKPDTGFRKVWKFRNSGGCTWTENFSFVWVGGPNLATQGIFYFRDLEEFPAGGVANGEVLKVKILMQAPSEVGRYKSYWMLRDDYGNLFGWGQLGDKAFWVEIRVRKY